MRVLNLVTTVDSPFFELQLRVLEGMGVECETVSVSTHLEKWADSDGQRSITDYARFYSDAFKRSLGAYDIVHANYGLTAPVAIAQPNYPVVLTLWGSDLTGRVGYLSRVCATFADEVIVMTDEMAEKLGQECHIVPHGVDTDLFKPMPKEPCREELGWDPECLYVLFPYRPDREVKNYPRAKRVFEAAQERLEGDVELQVILGIEHSQMPVYMNAADAMLFTSHREGSPNTVKEALACNLPVVATDVGDLSKQLDGVSPSAVCRSDSELIDALVAILREGMPSNGSKKVEREMSSELMGEQILEVYKQAMD